jgi:Trk K+ transport system NAD-binding subunit
LVELGRVLKHHYMVDNIYALTNDEMTSLLLKEIGIKSFTPKEASWLLLREMVQAPFMTSALLEQTEEKVFELDVEPGPLNGKTLMELAQIMPKDVRVLLVTRNGEVIMPKGTTLIKEGDTLTLIGKEESLKTLEDLCVGGVCKIK